jgi:thiol-disulfide isomerase/thioredoxin
MNRAAAMLTAIVLTSLVGFRVLSAGPNEGNDAHPRDLPEFTQRRASDWINSPPLRVSALRGKVLLLDVWTFECWNCYRSFPWLTAMEQRLAGESFAVIGIHSPEFERERDRAAVAAKAREFGLAHPIMIDNDMRYWRALDNRYWPAYYLVDKHGRIRAVYVGETHADTPQARKIEAELRDLLAEPAPP